VPTGCIDGREELEKSNVREVGDGPGGAPAGSGFVLDRI